MPSNHNRSILQSLFDAAVNAARGEDVLVGNSSVVEDRWGYCGDGGQLEVPLPQRSGPGRVFVVGAGKAAASLARGMERVLDGRVDSGIVIVKHGHGEELQRVRVLEASHPTPDQSSLTATSELLQALETTTEADTVFFMLSGGASSLLVAPAAGLSFEDKAVASQLLVNSGAPIEAINTVRKHLSAVKGGRLRRRVRARAFCTLAISDVIGDDPSTIGSGPTVPDDSTFADAMAVIEHYGLLHSMPPAVLTYLRRGIANVAAQAAKPDPEMLRRSAFRIIASNRMSIDACAAQARRLGCQVRILSSQMSGHTHEAARKFAEALRAEASRTRGDRAPVVLLAGGETTLTVHGTGRGGRNQEFATVAALELQGVANVTLLAAGTDGTDGPTDAAGAFADGTSILRARAAGLDVQEYLRRNDVYPLLDALGDLHRTGPTGTNVMDLVIGLAH